MDQSSASKKRRPQNDEASVEDLLGQICSKMDSLSTQEKNSEADMLDSFTSVLKCTKTEAQFFLESSAWDIENAVVLWLDSGRGEQAKRFRQWNSQEEIFEERELHIMGLSSDWSARVHPSTGCVYFTHIPTGSVQSTVPAELAPMKRRPNRQQISSSYSDSIANHNSIYNNIDGIAEPMSAATAGSSAYSINDDRINEEGLYDDLRMGPNAGIDHSQPLLRTAPTGAIRAIGPDMIFTNGSVASHSSADTSAAECGAYESDSSAHPGEARGSMSSGAGSINSNMDNTGGGAWDDTL